ncbi:MAG: hypothetical protein PHO55_00405 [Thiomonas arsenitoxydans]|nr:hypothetical protein [Thiomonas arsenitoxydans]
MSAPTSRPPLRAVSTAELRVQPPERIGDLLAETIACDRIQGLIPSKATIFLSQTIPSQLRSPCKSRA